MASVDHFGSAFAGKQVLVTGHTGFQGAWLCEWLLLLGAEVTGMALPPATVPSLFEQARLSGRVHHFGSDLRVPSLVEKVMLEAQPDFVFHLAAQTSARLSRQEAAETWQTNVMGTINVLESLRKLTQPCAAVFITTDQHRGNGGEGDHDLYRSSKGAAEMAINAWRRSYFPASHPVRLASASTASVIGGGDWAPDRLVPQAMRALAAGRPIPVCEAHTTRPWQHVLEALSGYLSLAAQLVSDASSSRVPSPPAPSARRSDSPLSSAFSFPPARSSHQPVRHLVEEILRHWPGTWEDRSAPHPHLEASAPSTAPDPARSFPGWQPVWDFQETVHRTVTWYREAPNIGAAALTRRQIEEYVLSSRTIEPSRQATGT